MIDSMGLQDDPRQIGMELGYDRRKKLPNPHAASKTEAAQVLSQRLDPKSS
ncbi:MAG: hypothetical protein ACE5OZ_04420 [Candidatus Heimdallarchaeota archaeon]